MSALQIGLLSLGDCLDDPVGGGRPTPAERQRAIVESAVQAERLGFDSAWLGEHPFCDSVLSAPPVVLAAIAARTERLRLGGQLRWPTRNEAKPSEAHPSGTGLTVLANLDPVRAAEDYATLDGISGGRVELVAGRGLLADPDEAFGQETDESRERFRENVELLLRLWTETEVSWSGRFRAPLERVTVEPRPMQQPHPPLWIGGVSADSVDLAAKLGLPLMLPSVLAPPEHFAPLVERYRERAALAGRPARVGACHQAHVAADSRAAREGWRPYYLNSLGFVDRVRQRRERVPPHARGSLGYDRLLADGVALCGSPAEVAERMLATRERLGLDVQLLIFDLGGLPAPALRETLERFGTDALPLLRAS